MSAARNRYLDTGFSESDDGEGYDSEAADYSKARSKRRKLSLPELATVAHNVVSDSQENQDDDLQIAATPKASKEEWQVSQAQQLSTKTSTEPSKPAKAPQPGVIYLSSLPPYLKPSALRNLLTQRGFSPISRLFLAPASKAKNHHSSKKSSRQLYSEGWIEFASKKTAKRCAETLNATTVGGRKGGFYHDDILNMKYLRGIGWDDLMAQVREERREEEARRTEERGQIARETKDFIEGVERGKVARGIDKTRKKRRLKAGAGEEPEVAKSDGLDSGPKRTWRQYRVKETGSGRQVGDGESVAVKDDVKRVLSKIF